MRSYEAARNLFSFLAFFAWSIIIFGGIMAIVVAGSLSNAFGGQPSGTQVMVAALPGLTLAVIGFLTLALVQMGRASVDSAEYSQQMLDVSRRQLDVAQQALELNRSRPVSYEGVAPAKSDVRAPNATTSEASYANQPPQEAPAIDPPAKTEIVFKDGQ